MTSFNPALYSYEGELGGLQPKVILHSVANWESSFPSYFIPMAGRIILDLTESSVFIVHALASTIGLHPNT